MKKIKIELDFLIGPIVKDVFDSSTNTLVTGVSVIDKDVELSKINSEISQLYSSFFEFENNGEPCSFKESKLVDNKDKLLELLDKLNNRLNKINDGSFVVEDLATPTLIKKELI